MMFGCGSLPGTKVLAVIEIQPIGDRGEIAPRPLRLQHREQLILAVEAAVAVVGGVGLALQFFRLKNQQRNPILLGERKSVPIVTSRQGGESAITASIFSPSVPDAQPRQVRPSPRRRNKPR